MNTAQAFAALVLAVGVVSGMWAWPLISVIVVAALAGTAWSYSRRVGFKSGHGFASGLAAYIERSDSDGFMGGTAYAAGLVGAVCGYWAHTQGADFLSAAITGMTVTLFVRLVCAWPLLLKTSRQPKPGSL